MWTSTGMDHWIQAPDRILPSSQSSVTSTQSSTQAQRSPFPLLCGLYYPHHRDTLHTCLHCQPPWQRVWVPWRQKLYLCVLLCPQGLVPSRGFIGMCQMSEVLLSVMKAGCLPPYRLQMSLVKAVLHSLGRRELSDPCWLSSSRGEAHSSVPGALSLPLVRWGQVRTGQAESPVNVVLRPSLSAGKYFAFIYSSNICWAATLHQTQSLLTGWGEKKGGASGMVPPWPLAGPLGQPSLCSWAEYARCMPGPGNVEMSSTVSTLSKLLTI